MFIFLPNYGVGNRKASAKCAGTPRTLYSDIVIVIRLGQNKKIARYAKLLFDHARGSLFPPHLEISYAIFLFKNAYLEISAESVSTMHHL